MGELSLHPVAAFPTAFTTDRAGRITLWSPRAATLFGRPAEAAVGTSLNTLFAAAEHERVRGLRMKAAGGQDCADEVCGIGPDGRARRLAMSCSPLLDGSGEASLLWRIAEVAADSRAEKRAVFMDALTETSPIGLLMVDTNLRYVFVNEALAEINGLPAESHIGLHLRDVVITQDNGAYEERIRETLKTGEALCGLVVSGRTVGRRDQDRAWSVSLFRLTSRDGETLGLGGIVVDVTDKETAPLEASAARQRLALLNEASVRVGKTLDVPRILSELISVAAPAFADLAMVELRDDLLDDPAPRPSGASVHLRRHRGPAADDLTSLRMPPRDGDVSYHRGSLLYDSLCAGRPLLVESLDETLTARLTFDPGQQRLLEDSRLGSLVAVPLIVRDRVLGMAIFGRTAERAAMTYEDLKLAQELAARAATCLDNALTYGKERRIAVALQRTMLPEDADIPHRPGLDIAHHYRPSGHAAQVGGDWFDVIKLSGHRVALVVGDVMGHDIHAAAGMGQLRTAMRTLAGLDLDPVDLLRRLGETVRCGMSVEYATCVYAVCDTVTRDCTIVSAGHLPPLLSRPDGTADVLSLPPGVPLGVTVDDGDYAVTHLTLPTDSTLVLYTDGLVERRDEDIEAGILALRDVLAGGADSVHDLCRRVAAELAPSPAEDDLAVLMARLPAVPEHRFTDWTLRTEPEAPARSRLLVRRTLDAWDLNDLADTAELLVSELVTNAVRYAPGCIRLRLAMGETLVCEVADDDVHMPRRRKADPDAEGGRGLVIVRECAQAWGTRPTASGKVVWFELAAADR